MEGAFAGVDRKGIPLLLAVQAADRHQNDLCLYFTCGDESSSLFLQSSIIARRQCTSTNIFAQPYLSVMLTWKSTAHVKANANAKVTRIRCGNANGDVLSISEQLLQ